MNVKHYFPRNTIEKKLISSVLQLGFQGRGVLDRALFAQS